jgi:hypothetical protein
MNMVPTADPAQDPDGCGRYVLRLANDSTDQQYVTRADYQMSPNKRIFVRDFVATTCTRRRGTPAGPTCSRRRAWAAGRAPRSTRSRAASIT